MENTRIFAFVLLGLFSSTLCQYADNTTTVAPGGSSSTSAPGSSPPSGSSHHVLTDVDMSVICSYNSAFTTICAASGEADAACANISASVKGSSPVCVAVNVCSFKVNGNPTGSNSTNATSPSGSPSATDGMSPSNSTNSTSTGAPTVSPTGAPSGSSTGPGGDAYISVGATAPTGYRAISICSNCQIIFVIPSSNSSSIPAGSPTVTPASNSTTAAPNSTAPTTAPYGS